MENRFEKASNVDTTKLVKKKGNVEYLNWAAAWAIFKGVYPRGDFDFVLNERDGYVFEEIINLKVTTNEDGITTTADGKTIGYFVKVRVTDGEEPELSHELPLPIMDFKNKANMNFTIMEVNKALMRCLTKTVAMFGAGLKEYAGVEWYQFEIGEEFDETKAKILEVVKEIVALDETARTEAIKAIGHDGHVNKIKDIDEARERLDSINALKETVSENTTIEEKEEK